MLEPINDELKEPYMALCKEGPHNPRYQHPPIMEPLLDVELVNANGAPVVALVKHAIELSLNDGKIYFVENMINRLQATMTTIKADMNTLMAAMSTIQSTMKEIQDLLTKILRAQVVKFIFNFVFIDFKQSKPRYLLIMIGIDGYTTKLVTTIPFYGRYTNICFVILHGQVVKFSHVLY